MVLAHNLKSDFCYFSAKTTQKFSFMPNNPDYFSAPDPEFTLLYCPTLKFDDQFI